MMTKEEFKAAREHAGITQERLAEMLDVSTKTISRYECGDYPIPKAVAFAMWAVKDGMIL